METRSEFFGRRASTLFLALSLLAVAPAVAQPAATTPAPADPLLDAFLDPPASARPRVWWHWMNGNIEKEGIAKDLAWMKRVGIGGLQNFDANRTTPQVVNDRLVYMSPEWKDAFRFAASEAERLGLELAIASSPGWSETGGPWVKPEDGLKKIVWSETDIPAGKRFTGKIATPPTVSGPFQTISTKPDANRVNSASAAATELYGDVALLAFPQKLHPVGQAKATDSQHKPVETAALWDGDFNTDFEVAAGGSAADPRSIIFEYASPQTIRSARLFAPKATAPFVGNLFNPRLDASIDGTTWQAVAHLPLGPTPSTVAFAPVTAKRFRLVLVQRSDVLDRIGQFGAQARQLFSANLDAMFARPVRIAEFGLSGDDKVDYAEAKAAFALVPDYFALNTPLPDVAGVGIGQVIDLTGRLLRDGTLDWTPPRLAAGQNWKVLRLGWSLTGKTNHPASPEATGLEVDKFDAAAVRRYMEHYLGMYRDASGGALGTRGVRALLMDSTEIGNPNWTPRLIEHFRRLRGYDPTPWLPALTGIIVGSRRKSDGFLYDFRRTLADLHASEHYQTIAAVAHENNLKLYGEALEDRRPVIGDDMALRRYADIPMAAMWSYSRDIGPRATLIADIKGAASVGHIYGQNLVAAESLTAAGPAWGWAPADLKRIIDLEFALGVNRPVIHTSVHSPVDDKLPGLSLGGIGQYFNRHETWAEMAKPWMDYLARNSLMLQQGRNVADVAYFYGEEAPLTGLYGEKPVTDAPKSYAYDFINADALLSALINDGNDVVTLGGARYRAIYLGGQSRQMTLPTLRRLAHLAEGGATIIGLAPVGNPGLAGSDGEWEQLVARLWPGMPDAKVGKGHVVASANIEDTLQAIGLTPDFKYQGDKSDSEILFSHRRWTEGESYFISNRRDRSETIEARFRVTGLVPEIWRAETGTSEPVSYRITGGETIVPITLAADGALHVVFRKPTDQSSQNFASSELVELARIDGPWTVGFQSGRGAPATTRMEMLTPLDQHSEPGIKYFSGVADYTTHLRTPQGWKSGQPLQIELGKVGDVAEVWLNGKLAGTTWHAPHRVDISKFAKRGQNQLEVRVANLWVNRMIGDGQKDAVKITWTGLQAYKAADQLRPAGLIGPVSLLGEGR